MSPSPGRLRARENRRPRDHGTAGTPGASRSPTWLNNFTFCFRINFIRCDAALPSRCCTRSMAHTGLLARCLLVAGCEAGLQDAHFCLRGCFYARNRAEFQRVGLSSMAKSGNVNLNLLIDSPEICDYTPPLLLPLLLPPSSRGAPPRSPPPRNLSCVESGSVFGALLLYLD